MNLSYSYIEKKAEDILVRHDFFKPGFNIEELTAKVGVNLHVEDLDTDTSGLFVMLEGSPIITVNKSLNSNPNRKRFTIAHELGHFFLHSKESQLFIDKIPRVMFRNSASSSGEILQEKEANAFAAALLMPKVLIVDNITDTDSDNLVEVLAKSFQVSKEAMSFRLANLGYDIGMI